MNVALSPDQLARACADAMWEEDDASKGLGMEIVEVGPGRASMAMTVKPHMVNGQRIAHGGFIFLLADSAFAFACNSPQRARRGGAVRHHLHPAGQARRPAGRDRTRNLAQRPLRDLRHPRHRGEVVIAEFRGHSRTIAGTWLPAVDGDAK